MNEVTEKRRYRDTLEFIEAGFRACLRNATELVAASKNLIENGLHAPALSIAVLALEEIGKMCATDGLLFAGAEDHKAKRFGKSQRDHDIKLSALPLLPIFIDNLSLVDPRRYNDSAYAQALAFGLHQLQADANAVLRAIQSEDFCHLNNWKKRGFYVTIEKNAFKEPREAIDKKHAEIVCHFAWRAVSTFEFVLMGGNLERYIGQARIIRNKAGEHDHQVFEEIGRLIADDFFGVNEQDSSNKTIN